MLNIYKPIYLISIYLQSLKIQQIIDKSRNCTTRGVSDFCDCIGFLWPTKQAQLVRLGACSTHEPMGSKLRTRYPMGKYKFSMAWFELFTQPHVRSRYLPPRITQPVTLVPHRSDKVALGPNLGFQFSTQLYLYLGIVCLTDGVALVAPSTTPQYLIHLRGPSVHRVPESLQALAYAFPDYYVLIYFVQVRTLCRFISVVLKRNVLC